MPLAGGTQVPGVAPAALPNDLFLAGGSGAALLRRGVDASAAPTGPATTANSSLDWSTVRGAFVVNGTVFYGLPDGRLYRRTFNATTGATGAQQVVNLYDDPETGQRIPFAIADLTGMAYDPGTHRIYYTILGDSRLHYRYFTPESSVVGAQDFIGGNGGVDLSRVAGMTVAGGRLLYGSSADGALRSAPFAGGRVTGAPVVTSNDGSWRYRANFTAR